jgi:phospholipid/cholesterol/gamma-HCH transport system substrate-binding protein
MNREIGRWRAMANAGFALAILALAGFGMAQVASRQWRIQKTFPVHVDFATIGGLGVGQRVRIQGIDAGVVEAAVPPRAPGQPVHLVLRVDERLRPLIRSDAMARIVTEGVVGSKVIEIAPGRPDAPPLPPSGLIAAERPLEMNDLLQEARASLRRLDTVAAAAEQGLGEINAIASSIRKGEGTLGKLVQDDEAYQKLIALSSRGERTLHDVEENLAALKRTWPLSRYFNDRSFFDRDRVLYHPGAERDSQIVREADLFEPGRAVLTAAGRQKLDSIAAWFKTVRRPSSEVVIAAFTDSHHDQELAQILTQEQADAVRKYLVSKHSIQSTGWFGSRKVAAVGFGGQVPRSLAEGARDQPPRRVEIILFTPQT